MGNRPTPNWAKNADARPDVVAFASGARRLLDDAFPGLKLDEAQRSVGQAPPWSIIWAKWLTVVLLGLADQEKPTLCLSISEQFTREKGWHAGNIIKELAREIEGGGGGQAFYATAGGSRPEGLDVAISKLKEYIK